ncbi:ribonuclease HI family protein [Herpetosiphon llansteffanensis]
MNIWLQIDATPGNLQGWAGLGIVLRQNDGTILQWALHQAPAATNNVAEYQALVYGLRLVQRHYPQARVTCLTDSLLIVDHLEGRCAVRTPHLHPLHSQACQLISRCVAFRVLHIRRAYNRLADALAWEALSGSKMLVDWVNQ